MEKVSPVKQRRKFIKTLSLSVLLFYTSSAEAEKITARIIEYGRYKIEVTEGVTAPAKDRKTINVIKSIRLIEQTDRIPCKIGEYFGFFYALNNLPVGKRILLRFIILHPPMISPDRGMITSREYTIPFKADSKKAVSYRGTKLRYDWQLVPGKWTFQIYYKDKKLLEKNFHVEKFKAEVTTLVASAVREGGKTVRMSKLIPYEIYGWRAQNEGVIYNRETIFDYMNGAGEIYLAYNFQELLVRRFVKVGQPDIIVELFNMGITEDAFGVFTYGQGRDDRERGIGQGSEYSGGLLCFWKGNFFVCILTKRETPSAKKAVLDLGMAIANTITVTGSRPKIVGYLLEEGLIEKSLRYFHRHTSLNYHYYITDQNILNLNEHTEAVLARYQQAEGRSYLLLIRYPSRQQAERALKSFLNAYMPEAKQTGVAQMENGKWTSAKVEKEFVIIVFDTLTKAQAEDRISEVRNKLMGKHP
ncbi:MAG: DUF6599 family protein [Nitrospirota bacterium]